MRNVDGIVKIKSSLRRKCIEISYTNIEDERERVNGRAREPWQCIVSRRALVVIGTHTATHSQTRSRIRTQDSDRQALTHNRVISVTFDVRIAPFRYIIIIFFSVSKLLIAFRVVTVILISLSLYSKWHGFPLALPHYALHTHLPSIYCVCITTVAILLLVYIGMDDDARGVMRPYRAVQQLIANSHTMHTLHHVGQFYSFIFIFCCCCCSLPSSSSSTSSSFMLVLKPLNYWYVCVWTACSGTRARYQIDLFAFL